MCLAIPARLVEYLDEDHNYGKVELGGVIRRVNTTMLRNEDSAEVGDHVLVHVGFAMAKVSPEEAQNTLRILEQMGSVYEDEIKEIRKSLALGEEATDADGNTPLDVAAAAARKGESRAAAAGSSGRPGTGNGHLDEAVATAPQNGHSRAQNGHSLAAERTEPSGTPS